MHEGCAIALGLYTHTGIHATRIHADQVVPQLTKSPVQIIAHLKVSVDGEVVIAWDELFVSSFLVAEKRGTL